MKRNTTRALRYYNLLRTVGRPALPNIDIQLVKNRLHVSARNKMAQQLVLSIVALAVEGKLK